jgi:hypothetical protein
MKEFNKQALKFKITEDKIKMEITLEDLKNIFELAPNNTYDGENIAVTIKEDRLQDFTEYVVRFLLDDEFQDSSMPNWGVPFQRAFDEIIEGYEDFGKYTEYD